MQLNTSCFDANMMCINALLLVADLFIRANQYWLIAVFSFSLTEQKCVYLNCLLPSTLFAPTICSLTFHRHTTTTITQTVNINNNCNCLATFGKFKSWHFLFLFFFCFATIDKSKYMVHWWLACIVLADRIITTRIYFLVLSLSFSSSACISLRVALVCLCTTVVCVGTRSASVRPMCFELRRFGAKFAQKVREKRGKKRG